MGREESAKGEGDKCLRSSEQLELLPWWCRKSVLPVDKRNSNFYEFMLTEHLTTSTCRIPVSESLAYYKNIYKKKLALTLYMRVTKYVNKLKIRTLIVFLVKKKTFATLYNLKSWKSPTNRNSRLS